MTKPEDRPPYELPRDLQRSAERLLAQRFGASVKVDGYDVLREQGRAAVLRLRLAGGGGPETAVLKVMLSSDGGKYDSRMMRMGAPAYRLLTETSALEFVASATPEGTRPLAPALYGYDRARGIAVIEDLGDGPSLADLLLGDDAAAADAAMMAFARDLGRMHSLTAPRVERFEARLEELGLPLRPKNWEGGGWHDDVRLEIQKFPQTFDEFEFEWTPGMVDDVQQMAASLLEPGPFLALTHGDPCPDNVRFIDGRIVFFDFEAGGLRNAFLDGAHARVPFPTCWCTNRIPEGLVGRMEEAYRAELLRSMRQVADERVFRRGIVQACAFWMIAGANLMFPRALRLEQRWGISTYRQRLMHRFDVFARTSQEFGELEALGAWAVRTRRRMEVKWPEVKIMPLYPAFASGSR